MSLVRIDASPKQLSKLRNGHKVRIKPPKMEGQGFNLMVHPDRFDTISKTFNRGKGMEIQLSPDEIVANQQNAHLMEGKGIFGKKFDRFLEKTIGKSGKDIVYKVGDVLKEPAKRAIDTAAKYAPELGATALSGLALAAGQPELVPFAGMAGERLGRMAGNFAGSKAKDYLDHPTKYQNMLTSNAGGPRSSAPTTLAGQVAQSDLLHNLNQDLGTKYGALARANLLNSLAHMERGNMTKDQVELEHQLGDANALGQGLYAGGGSGGLYAGGSLRRRKEVGSIGRGSNFVAHQAHLPPALQSQPFSANFQFQHFLPPSYQKFSKGSGLYS